MAGKFGDLVDYFDPGLTLTVQGREYVIPLPSAELGLWCRMVADMAGHVGDDASAEDAADAAGRAAELPDLPGNLTFTERLLGDVYKQMLTDQVPDPYVKFSAATVYIWIVAGEDTARRFWEAGGQSPEASGPANRAERRAAQRSSTGAATTTRPQGSSSGTSSRKRSGKRGKPARSPGRTS